MRLNKNKQAKDNISSEDSKLFRDHVSDVLPLKQDKLSLRKKRTQTMQNETLTTPIYACETSHIEPIDPDQSLFYAKSNLPTSLLKKLKRGNLEITAKIDLHGMTIAQTEQALNEFISHCQQSQERFALIIHGKGFRYTTNQIGLKSFVNHYLRQDTRILAFCSALSKHGGTGALYTVIKQLRN